MQLQASEKSTTTASADNQHILIAGVFGTFGTVAHHQAFRLRQDDVVLKYRINKGLDVFWAAPPGRTVLHILPVFFGVLALHIDGQPQGSAAEQAHQ